MADSFETNNMQGMVTMLAKSATFQTLVGVDSEADARKHIIKGWGGSPEFGEVTEGKAISSNGTDEITLSDSHAHVMPIDYNVETSATRNFEGWNGTVRIAIVIADSGANPAAKFEYVLNTIGNIRAECFSTTLTEATGVPALAALTLSGFERQEKDSAYNGATIAYIDVNWRVP